MKNFNEIYLCNLPVSKPELAFTENHPKATEKTRESRHPNFFCQPINASQLKQVPVLLTGVHEFYYLNYLKKYYY